MEKLTWPVCPGCGESEIREGQTLPSPPARMLCDKCFEQYEWDGVSMRVLTAAEKRLTCYSDRCPHCMSIAAQVVVSDRSGAVPANGEFFFCKECGNPALYVATGSEKEPLVLLGVYADQEHMMHPNMRALLAEFRASRQKPS